MGNLFSKPTGSERTRVEKVADTTSSFLTMNHLPTFFWSIPFQTVLIFLYLIHVPLLLFLHHRHAAHKFLWYIVQLPVMPSTGNRSITQLRLKSHECPNSLYTTTQVSLFWIIS